MLMTLPFADLKEIMISCQKCVAFITNNDLTVFKMEKNNKNSQWTLIIQIDISAKPLSFLFVVTPLSSKKNAGQE